MATILDTLKKGAEYLQKHEVDEARLNMEWLIAHVLKIGRMQLYIDFERDIPEAQLETLRDLTKRRGRGEPLQHLLGTVEFCDLAFKSDRRALIPRPETEDLTRKLLAREWPTGAAILDLGCGSGVIGLSLAHGLMGKAVSVTLADLSAEALTLATENAIVLPEGSQVRFVESDLFSSIDGSYDLITANLPYIPDADETELSREVRRDPALALYGGPIGTEIMERFLRESSAYLNPGGLIAMEFGIGQAETLRLLAEDLGYDAVEIQSDLGGIERFLFATKSE
jgi:release factor glutamine methyltransferase